MGLSCLASQLAQGSKELVLLIGVVMPGARVRLWLGMTMDYHPPIRQHVQMQRGERTRDECNQGTECKDSYGLEADRATTACAATSCHLQAVNESEYRFHLGQYYRFNGRLARDFSDVFRIFRTR